MKIECYRHATRYEGNELGELRCLRSFSCVIDPEGFSRELGGGLCSCYYMYGSSWALIDTYLLSLSLSHHSLIALSNSLFLPCAPRTIHTYLYKVSRISAPHTRYMGFYNPFRYCYC